MTTRWEVVQSSNTLSPADFIHLQGGPRDGDTLLAPGHTGKVCLGLAPNVPPRLGAELIYEPTGKKTAEGARVYRQVVRTLVDA